MTGIMKAPSDDRHAARHPIRVVANRTGLTPTLLRAWERRYGLVDPARTDSGQRLYSDADIERLALLRQATEAGRSIRLVADLTVDELRQLIEDDARNPAAAFDDGTARRVADFASGSMRAIETMDADRLEAELRRALVVLGVDTFTDDFLAPLLRDIGEPVATAVVQRVLNWMLEAPPPLRDGPVAIMGTLSGEQHELGALLAAAAAALEGWRVTFLGRDLPAHDLALAARTLDARMVAVSTVHATDLDEFEEQLTELLDGLAGDVDVFVGGVRARELRLAQTDDRLHVAHSLAEFREAIRGTGVPA
jgi:DNA-binding transcriptional MerR regulator